MPSADDLAKKRAGTQACNWTVREAVETTIVVTNGFEEALVDWNHARWECSECPSPRGKSAQTCEHIMAACRDLPLRIAVGIAEQVAGRKREATPGSLKREAEIQKARAAVVEAGAQRRAERAAEHDRTFAGASEVVVRQAKPEDLERLRLARERKALRSPFG